MGAAEHTGLRDRVGVISGASAGIGLATARRLLGEGVRLVLNARRADRLEAVASEFGRDRVALAPGDAGEDATVLRMLDTAREAFGAEADLVIVNAGRGLMGSPMTSDRSQWEQMLRVNLLGAASLMREAGARMLADIERRGDWQAHPHDIVVLGSIAGRHISPFSSLYGSTKFGVNSLAEAMRREVGPRGVRVTLVEPAVVTSEFQGVAGYDEAWSENFAQRFGPLLEPDDVAGAIVFAAGLPARVHLNDFVIRPTRQDYP